MQIRDRVKELRRVRAGDLLPNPKNWRTHPQDQQDALRGLLAEVGYADALIAREVRDDRLMLLDGHLRAETTPETIVPVLVVDLTEAEADKVLASLDPLAGMAEANAERLGALLAEVETDSDALAAMLRDLAAENGIDTDTDTEAEDPDTSPQLGELQYRVLVECAGEGQQAELVAKLEAEGYKCQPLMS